MNKKAYSISYFRYDDGTFLDCRQCRHYSIKQTAHEAELYCAWARYHYGCEVVFEIKAQ